MRRILLATDGSEAAREAFEFAVSLAAERGAELHVVVVRPARGPDERSALPDLESVRAATRIADRAVAEATHRDVRALAHVARGDAGRVIAEAAVRLGAEMIVVGARGAGHARDLQFGSVSLAVAMRSPVPVTVVREPAGHAA